MRGTTVNVGLPESGFNRRWAPGFYTIEVGLAAGLGKASLVRRRQANPLRRCSTVFQASESDGLC